MTRAGRGIEDGAAALPCFRNICDLGSLQNNGCGNARKIQEEEGKEIETG